MRVVLCRIQPSTPIGLEQTLLMNAKLARQLCVSRSNFFALMLYWGMNPILYKLQHSFVPAPRQKPFDPCSEPE